MKYGHDIREYKNEIEKRSQRMSELYNLQGRGGQKLTKDEEVAIDEEMNRLIKEICDFKCKIADEILYNGEEIFHVAAVLVDDFYREYNESLKE